MPLLRRARPADAPRLAVFAEQIFRATFGSQCTTADLNLHCQLSYSEAIQAREIAAADWTTLLCEDGPDLAGFAQVRVGPAPACVSARAPGEIHRFYVVPAWQGRGVAQTLMRACLAELQARGTDVVWLGVFERNPRAIAFYRKFGFAPAGTHVFHVGHDPQRDLILSRPTVTE